MALLNFSDSDDAGKSSSPYYSRASGIHLWEKSGWYRRVLVPGKNRKFVGISARSTLANEMSHAYNFFSGNVKSGSTGGVLNEEIESNQVENYVRFKADRKEIDHSGKLLSSRWQKPVYRSLIRSVIRLGEKATELKTIMSSDPSFATNPVFIKTKEKFDKIAAKGTEKVNKLNGM